MSHNQYTAQSIATLDFPNSCRIPSLRNLHPKLLPFDPLHIHSHPMRYVRANERFPHQPTHPEMNRNQRNKQSIAYL